MKQGVISVITFSVKSARKRWKLSDFMTYRKFLYLFVQVVSTTSAKKKTKKEGKPNFFVYKKLKSYSSIIFYQYGETYALDQK